MSLNINCSSCGRELNRAGALLFSPPKGQLTKKFHLCVDCWDNLQQTLIIRGYNWLNTNELEELENNP